MKTKPLGYTDSRGLSELRHALTRYESSRHLQYDPDKEILVTPGAKQAIYYILVALLNKGDEVILLEPTWLGYAEAIRLAGGSPVFVPLNAFRLGRPTARNTSENNVHLFAIAFSQGPLLVDFRM